MITFEDIKQKYLDHLAEINLTELSMSDLATYGCILRNVDEMLKPSYAEQMAGLMMGCACKKEESGNG